MRSLVRFLAATLAVLVCTVSFAAEHGSPDQAKAMLAKAVAYMKANGKDKSLATFNDKQGGFVDGDIYVTVTDLNGKTLAHPVNARLVGKDNINLQDAEGKFFYKERMEAAKAKGHGEQEYKVLNPVTKDVENKIAFFERVGDTVIACGSFKP
jgi:signal transduction histidine kinase